MLNTTVLQTAQTYPIFLQDYPYTCEELDIQLPQAFNQWLETTIMVNSSHAHDENSSLSNQFISWVGSTPAT